MSQRSELEAEESAAKILGNNRYLSSICRSNFSSLWIDSRKDSKIASREKAADNLLMSQNWELAGEYFVEIWFRIEKDEDGYPKSKKWEQLLARPVLKSEEYFQIESVPFFLKDVSRGDIVKAKVVENDEIQEGEIFEFESIVDRGGHNTYQLLLKKQHPNDPEYTTEELLEIGLGIEEQYGDFFAVDVPPTVDQQAIDVYLLAECDLGRWEMQDGYLHTRMKHRKGSEVTKLELIDPYALPNESSVGSLTREAKARELSEEGLLLIREIRKNGRHYRIGQAIPARKVADYIWMFEWSAKEYWGTEETIYYIRPYDPDKKVLREDQISDG